MKPSRFTDRQTVDALKRAEARFAMLYLYRELCERMARRARPRLACEFLQVS